ncbi:hypothetical protein IWQ48_001089 [Labrenzia sp. EL_13]|nr:hypothetical protein [Labrenzia sp. EL_13]
MAIGTLLFSLLSAGAQLAATGVLSKFAEGAGETAFESLKARLTNALGLKSIGLLEEAKDNDAYETAIQSDLNKPEVEADGEVRRLAKELQAALAEMPAETAAAYAIDIEEIRAGKNLLFEDVDGGIRGKKATAGGNLTFKRVKAPNAGKS